MTSEPSTDDDYDSDSAGFLTSTKLYIVIACIASLVFIAILQACCTIYKMSKKSSAKRVIFPTVLLTHSDQKALCG